MLRPVLFDWGGTLMNDEWSDEIALEGHSAGLAALAREGLGASRVGMRTVQAVWFRADQNPNAIEADYQAFTQMDVLNLVDRLAA